MSKTLKRLVIYYLYLFFAWGIFRYFVRLPEVIVELWFKPVIWLFPLLWWRMSMKTRLDLFAGSKLKVLMYGLFGGLFYYILLRYVAGVRAALDPDVAGVALAIATVEELTFAGVLLPVLVGEFKSEWWALVVTSLMYATVRLPINIFVYHLPSLILVGAFWLAFFVCLFNSFLRLRSKNVLSPILAHAIYLLTISV